MKKIVASMLAACMLFGVPVLAESGSVQITELSVRDGVIAATVTNHSTEKSRITLELIKDHDPLTDEEEIYALYQKVLDGGASMVFTMEIPDERNGIPGTGDYYIEVENADEERDKISFQYADVNTLQDFIQELQTESAKVTQAEDAQVFLLPVFAKPAYRGVFFRLGLNYDAFNQQTEAVKKETMKQLYLHDLMTVHASNFSSVFKGVYGLAVYNQGVKLDGLNILSQEYNQMPMDAGIMSSITTMLQTTYTTYEALMTDATVAYGLETINRADVNAMEAALHAFQQETGLCVNEVAQIHGLSIAKKYSAFEAIVVSCRSNRLTSQVQLQALLTQVYQNATKDPQPSTPSGGGGGGGGGGAAGGVTNRDPIGTDAFFGATGSGTPENKIEPVSIFNDLTKDHWASNAVLWMKNQGIVNGTETGAFEPERAVTREEFTKMLVLACGIQLEEATTEFADVSPDGWYAPYISTAVKHGIVNGMDSKRFGVGQNITRQDMSVMVKRALEVTGASLEAVRTYAAFLDENGIADYAQESVKALFEAGIINGKGDSLFDPAGNATRAESAKIIYEALKGGN